jgi:hypothetical protein
MNPLPQVERTVRKHKLPGLEGQLPEEFVLPHYGGYSIANLPATIGRLLGVELRDTIPPLPDPLWADMAQGVRRVVIVVLDAVGYLQLQRVLQLTAAKGEDSPLNRLVRAGRLVPLTSVFPSTTVVALTTLWTGQAPAGHGFAGTKLLLSQQGVLANMLGLSPAAHRQPGALLEWGWDPDDFVPVPSLGQQLSDAGVQTVAHTHLPFVRDGLARIFMRGIESVQGHAGFSDMWINIRHTLTQRDGPPPTGRGRLFVSGYWGDIDHVAHVYGPDGEPFQAALRHLARSLEEDLLAPLPADAREGTLLILTADHGQTHTPPERAVWLSDHPSLQHMLLLPPAGEPRAAYVYVRPGKTEAVRAYAAEHLADRFLLLEMDQALAAGLFGPGKPSPEFRARLGDLLLLARNDGRLLVEEEKVPFHGHHGGLTAEEMLVPLLMVRLDGV